MSRGRPYLLTRPEQGWSSLLLLTGMLVLLGISIADSRPFVITDSGSLTDSLPAVMLAGALIGYVLARSALGVVRAHVIGAAVAATLLLLVTGAWLSGLAPLPMALDGIGGRVSAVWMALVEDLSGDATTYLVLGAICWTTAQFSAFSVFRYDRGGPAVMAVGTMLFLNVGLATFRADEDLLPVIPVLATFAALALLLLMRMQLVQQRYAWARRHISDTQDVSRLFIRSGVAFVIVAVLSASSLTVWATVEAQELDVDGIEEPLQDLGDELAKILDFFGVPSGTPEAQPRGTSTALTTRWDEPTGVAFRARFDRGQLLGNYWWGWSDDQYDYENGFWRTTSDIRYEVPGGEIYTSEEAQAGGIDRVDMTITVNSGRVMAQLFRPPDAYLVGRDVEVREAIGGGANDIDWLDQPERGDDVVVTSFVRDYRPRNETLTAWELNNPSEETPPWVREAYLDGRNDPNAVGPRTRALADDLMDRFEGDYDRAEALQSYLRDMTYDLTFEACPDMAIPDCLLTVREGFCQQFATTMVMTLRAMGIPARFVTGYLPGDQNLDGSWTVENRALHNWAEAYFPGAGWIRFDPTPPAVGYNNEPTRLAPGEAPRRTPEPTAEPDEPTGPEATPEPEEEIVPPDEGTPPAGGDAGIGLGPIIGGISLMALLLATVTVLLLVRLRRLPEGDDGLAYRGIVDIATRLGHGPHPSQTEYEYVGALSKVVPDVRDDLYVVAGARVASAYGDRQLDEQRRGLLRRAYARIRTALLRLALRWRH